MFSRKDIAGLVFVIGLILFFATDLSFAFLGALIGGVIILAAAFQREEAVGASDRDL